jgi:pimeloyl-ACP methyl ester carboxylesterase
MPTSSIRGVELDHERQGSGRTLVWGHGLTSSRADEAVPPVLVDWPEATRHLDVVRYDARGHGRSGYTPDPRGYGWDRMALDQLALADELGIDRYVAGGASLGCATALHAAVAAPDRIEALVLVIPPTAWETRAAQADSYRQMGDIIEARGVEPIIAAGAELPVPEPFRHLAHWKQRSADRLRAADPVRLAGLFRGAATADFPPRESVAAIVVPALILAWTGDPSHPVGTARELDRLLPAAELHEATTLDEFGTWTGRIVDFLA